MVKDKVMSEVGLNANKNALQTKRTAAVQRQGRTEKVSNSTDANPIAKQGKLAPGMQREMSKAEIPRGQLNIKNEATPAPKLTLGPTLKIEIAKQPAKQREGFLDAAYALEEILQAVEKGDPVIERLLNKDGEKKKPLNKVLEDRQKKADLEAKKEQDDRKKLDERKRLLKEQLDKMKEDKKKKTQEDKLKKKKEDEREEAKAKKKQEKLNADMTKLKEEFTAKREAKQKEIEEKKAGEPAQVDPATKKEQNKANLKQRKEVIIEDMKAKAEARTNQKQVEEERKVKKEQLEKQKAEQIKKMYQETKEKAKEMKDRFKEEYDRFYNSPKVQAVFSTFEKALMTFMEIYSKFDGVPLKEGQAVTLSYNAYMNMGKKLRIYPDIVSSQDYVYIYKTMMKIKMKAEKEGLVKYDTLQDVQGTKLNFNEFKEMLLKIACLGKYKIPGGAQLTEDEIRLAKNEEKKKKKDALTSAAASGVLKKPKDEFDEGHVNEDLLNVFEKEFDVNDMTEKTIESLFKNVLLLKPDKPAGVPGGLKSVRASGASPEKSIKAQPVRIGGSSDDI
ncbi:hypothetical protein FGO68_gene2633 [Halteria grandinella]|uniref:Uncharacterized protein n=1 Tax=Halteria grandinella TaxID=5974 RepID=A0A8J8SW84_HALGN|nr:hypothetical protein FGO68_gene2633 [Halteria grandinella]